MRGICIAAVVALVGCASTPEKKPNPMFEPPSGNGFKSSFYDPPNGGPKEGMPSILRDYENEKK